MAASSGVTVLVLLLCCWRGAELQPINMTTGPTTETMSSKNLEDIPGVFDEILVEEILEPNKSSVSKTQKAGTTLSSKLFQEKNSGTGENYQLGGPEGHHELSDISQFSLGAQDKILNNEPNKDGSYQVGGLERYHGSKFPVGTEDRFHNDGKKKSKSDQHNNQSALDKILQNTGKSSGNSFQ
ncbi:sperm acrosome-associated protein 7-like isoform X1 [Vicugna pacos]|uniref:Sperm acrosome-associated protein 7-like isoform X1 n=1 Tax=Vicugna pacos TaxID=30538 RepID=A0ABM5BAQ4_VICPA